MFEVCHVQVQPILSGVQRAMLEMFRHIDRRRYRLHVVCQQPGPLSDELARQRIACHFIPSLGRAIHPWRDLTALLELRKFFRQHRFDLVHTHSSKPGILGRLAARWAGVPQIVHHVHSFAFHEFSSPLEHAIYARLERWAGQYCDHVIFVNHEERQWAVEHRLLRAEQCLTVHNGIDLDPFLSPTRFEQRQQFRSARQWSDDEQVILVIGRLDAQKQPLILADIAAALQTRCPAHRWRLAIAGSGSLESELRRLVELRELEQRVEFLGWQEHPATVYHAADIQLQPSLWEGLPLTLIEGHAATLSAVASNVKGNREVVTNETGTLCAPRAADEYAAALARLIVEPKFRKQQGQAARRRAIAHFDGSVNMRRIAELYDQWLAQEVTHSRIAA